MKGNLLNFIINTIKKFSLGHIHWLSFDLAASAMFLQIAFGKIPAGKTTVNPKTTLVLALGIFSIASLNKLLDHRKPAKAESKRFLTNQKERVTFFKIITGTLLTASIISFFLPEGMWKLALGLMFMSGAGIFLFSRLPERSPLHVVRAPLSALVLAAGIFGNNFFASQELVKEERYTVPLLVLILVQHFLLSAYFTALTAPNTSNMASRLGPSLSRQILHGMTMLAVTGCILICLKTEFRYTQRLIVILLSMSVLHSVILEKAPVFQSVKHKRLLITLILSLPFLIL